MTQPRPAGPVYLDELAIGRDVASIPTYLWIWVGEFSRRAGAEFGGRRPGTPDDDTIRDACAEALICQWWGLADDNAVDAIETTATIDLRGQGRLVLRRSGPGPALDKP